MGIFVLTIYETVSYFVLIIGNGLAGAVGIMAGISCGEKNGDDLKGIGVLSHRYNMVLSVCVMALLAASSFPLSRALTESEASAELLLFAFICIIINVPFTFEVKARISYLQAVGKVKEAHWMGIGADIGVLAMLSCLFAVLFGIDGVFMAFPISQIVILFFSWWIHCRRTKKILPQLSDYLEVDESFFVSPGDEISYSIGTREDCAFLSEQIMLFCRGHKIDDKKGFLAGLCAEELTTNVIEHGTSPRQTKRSADIRVVIDGEDVIIRTRDNGRPFNLKRFSERLAEEDKLEKGTGIRILINAAKNVSYYRTCGINTTIITV